MILGVGHVQIAAGIQDQAVRRMEPTGTVTGLERKGSAEELALGREALNAPIDLVSDINRPVRGGRDPARLVELTVRLALLAPLQQRFPFGRVDANLVTHHGCDIDMTIAPDGDPAWHRLDR